MGLSQYGLAIKNGRSTKIRMTGQVGALRRGGDHALCSHYAPRDETTAGARLDSTDPAGICYSHIKNITWNVMATLDSLACGGDHDLSSAQRAYGVTNGELADFLQRTYDNSSG